MSVRPLHFMSYKVDLPTAWAHLRSVPEFVAILLHREDCRSGEALKADELFGLQSRSNLFCRTFGVGFGDGNTFPIDPSHDRYRDEQPIDIESLLLVRLLENVTPPNPIVGKQGEVKPFQPLCPWEADRFRQDFSLFLRCYTPDDIPARVLGEYVLALLSLDLTVYFLAHSLSANSLYRTGSFETDKTAGKRRWEPAIFLDLTDGRDRKCRELARASYQRHVRIQMEHLRAMVGFRILERVLSNATHLPEIRVLKTGSVYTAEHFEAFARCRLFPNTQGFQAVQTFASMIISQLEEYDPSNRDFFSGAAVSAEALNPFDRLIEAVVLSDSELFQQLQKFHGAVARASILARPTAKRSDSYYTLTGGMLEMLIHLVPLRAKRRPEGRPMDVYEFVNELRARFGIWIDRPPSELDDSLEAHQAAKVNMDGLKEKLRQLGALRAVTDARGMQWLIPRYRSSFPLEEGPVA